MKVEIEDQSDSGPHVPQMSAARTGQDLHNQNLVALKLSSVRAGRDTMSAARTGQDRTTCLLYLLVESKFPIKLKIQSSSLSMW